MAKTKKEIIVKTEHYGLYAKWSNSCETLPKFLKYTTEIPARFEAEFGFTLLIKNGKNRSVDYTVIHPPFRDENGNIEPPFTGSLPIRKSPFRVYVGDTLWEPIEDKIGTWRFIAKIDNKIVEDKTFNIVDNTGLFEELITKYKNNHI
jgi:hypothetical protein